MNKKRWLPNASTAAVLPLTALEAPEVYFTAEAWRKINYIVDQCDKEVAWLGVVQELANGNYLISKIYVPRQEVTGASVDIDHDAMAQLVMRVMDDGYEVEQLRYHGHSHVNMGINPSGTDQDHIADYLEEEHCDFFLRSISNKKGEMKMDIFDKRLGFGGVTYQCVNTEVWESCQTKEWYEAVDQEIKENVVEPKRPAFSMNRNVGYWGPLDRVDTVKSNKPKIHNNEELVSDVMEYLAELDYSERDKWISSLSAQDRAVVSSAFNSYCEAEYAVQELN